MRPSEMCRSSPLSIAGALAGALLLLRIVLSWKSLAYYLGSWWRWLDERTQAYQYFEIPRNNESGQENPLYQRAAAYVSALPSLEDADASTFFSSGRKPNDFFLCLGPGHSAADFYLGSPLLWTNLAGSDGGGGGDRLVLRVRRPDRTRVLLPYLQQVESVADDLELQRRDIKLFKEVNRRGPGGLEETRWRSVPFTHPTTLETVAIDQDLKNRIRTDLEAFLRGRAYYHRLGRVWRRSYLLYGPTGTGKSTFVAAMAKFLCYDIYYVDLSRFYGAGSDNDLKSLLLTTSPRSIVLVEDLDLYLKGKSNAAYGAAAAGEGGSRLTGIMNFMDGIFSCCGEERVMAFTMTTPAGSGGGLEGLEPAVLRPGRLDVRIHFPLCDFSAFKTLASNCLGIKDHKLYPQVEERFQSGAKISQAEISEIMIANRSSSTRALKTIIHVLRQSATWNHVPESNGALPPDNGHVGAKALETPRVSSAASSRIGRMSFRKEPAVRELKKLCGLIKTKTTEEGSTPAEGGGVNYAKERSSS